MGFCPYFLQAHESDGGYASPLLRDPLTPPIGTDTTLFCTPLLLFFGDGVAANLASSPERGESGAVSGEPWGSSSCSLMKGLMWSLRSMMKKCCDGVTLGRSPLIPGGW